MLVTRRKCFSHSWALNHNYCGCHRHSLVVSWASTQLRIFSNDDSASFAMLVNPRNVTVRYKLLLHPCYMRRGCDHTLSYILEHAFSSPWSSALPSRRYPSTIWAPRIRRGETGLSRGHRMSLPWIHWHRWVLVNRWKC